MLKSTIILTLTTVLGLALGFGREWLIVLHWGVSGTTDAVLVAMFLTEAIRTMLGSGLVAAAALPLLTSQSIAQRPKWFSQLTLFWFLAGTSIAVLVYLFANPIEKLIGLGLKENDLFLADSLINILSISIPFIFLQSILAVPLQAANRYFLIGLGSFVFNLPVVIYMGIFKEISPIVFAWCLNCGSLCMVLTLIPYNYRMGHFSNLKLNQSESKKFIDKLWPLMVSSLTSQGLFLLERTCASLLGEGTVTIVNFARKLINLPLISLTSINQIFFSKMSQSTHAIRNNLLVLGLRLSTIITLPATIVFTSSSFSICTIALPRSSNIDSLSSLLACFAPSVIFGSWNAILARYFYSHGNTKKPLKFELAGSFIQGLLLITCPFLFGINGFGYAVMGGVVTTTFLLSNEINKNVFVEICYTSVIACVMLVLLNLLLNMDFFKNSIFTQLIYSISSAFILFSVGIYFIWKNINAK